MAEAVRSGEVVEAKLSGERTGPPDLLVDLDHPAGAHHADAGMRGPDRRLGLVGVALEQDDRVLRADVEHLAADRVPVDRRVGAVQRELAPPVRSRVAVDRHARGIRPALVHLDEHRGQVLPE